MSQGIILCHGRLHKPFLSSLPFFIPETNWILIDIDETSDPDVVADYTNYDETIQKLGGNEQYDYVVDMGCPVFDIEKLFNLAFSLLRPGGQFIFIPGVNKILTAYMLRYHHYINKYDVQYDKGDLIDFIIQIGAIPSINQLQQLNLVNDTSENNKILYSKFIQQDPILMKYLLLTLNKIANSIGFRNVLIPFVSANSQKLSKDVIFTK